MRTQSPAGLLSRTTRACAFVFPAALWGWTMQVFETKISLINNGAFLRLAGSRWKVSGRFVSVCRARRHLTSCSVLRSNYGGFEDLNALASHGDVLGAVAWIEKHGDQILPSKRTVVFNTLLKACANQGDAKAAADVYRVMTDSSTRVNVKTYGKLMEAAAKRGDVELAERWFKALLQSYAPTDVHLNTLIDACAKKKDPTKAATYFHAMQDYTLAPGLESYTAVIDACARAGHAADAAAWHQKMTLAGIQSDRIGFNSVINAWAKACNSFQTVSWLMKLKRAGIEPDVVSFTGIIDSYARRGSVHEAVAWLDRMRVAEVEPSVVTYNSVLNACASAGSAESVDDWFNRMRSHQVAPDVISYTAALKTCHKDGQWDTGKVEQILSEMFTFRVQPDRGFLSLVSRVLGSERVQSLGTEINARAPLRTASAGWKHRDKPSYVRGAMPVASPAVPSRKLIEKETTS
eukprot:TRINITY_DN30927_c0_g1_i1.p1 TRINITY_DN30927_c0_g1~~TRINITY_DN30927_c0_g1_i1.p1  ORF type:complete len:463 (-),score=31.49 TRINITY_DN30927_c0_g1_i1:9-1397(-)